MLGYIKKYKILLFLILVFWGCNNIKDQAVYLSVSIEENEYVSLITERDYKLKITGNFNQWDSSGVLLYQREKDQFTAELKEILAISEFPLDSLEFLFFITDSVDNVYFEEQFIRKENINELYDNKKKSAFVFNVQRVENFKNVKFTIDLEPQKVLGFFNPNAGDIIVLAGTFNNWSTESDTLLLNHDFVYERNVLVNIDSIKSLSYKYVIISEGNTRWESTQPHSVTYRDSSELITDYFNDMAKVVRIFLDTESKADGRLNKNVSRYFVLFNSELNIDKEEMFYIGENRYELSFVPPDQFRDMSVSIVDSSGALLDSFYIDSISENSVFSRRVNVKN